METNQNRKEWLLAGIGVLVLGAGCGAPTVDASSRSAALHSLEAIPVELEKVGNPAWGPVDFHNVAAPYHKAFDAMQAILPPPNHSTHPQLGLSPGAPHAGPYDHEIAEGVAAQGLTDAWVLTKQEFTHGRLVAWMMAPLDGAPLGRSPDSNLGPIIPNAVFPIHVQLQYAKDNVVEAAASFDVPALDDHLNPPFFVDGHSHFPLYTNDAAAFYSHPTPGAHLISGTLIDAAGEGWRLKVPYTVVDHR